MGDRWRPAPLLLLLVAVAVAVASLLPSASARPFDPSAPPPNPNPPSPAVVAERNARRFPGEWLPPGPSAAAAASRRSALRCLCRVVCVARRCVGCVVKPSDAERRGGRHAQWPRRHSATADCPLPVPVPAPLPLPLLLQATTWASLRPAAPRPARRCGRVRLARALHPRRVSGTTIRVARRVPPAACCSTCWCAMRPTIWPAPCPNGQKSSTTGSSESMKKMTTTPSTSSNEHSDICREKSRWSDSDPRPQRRSRAHRAVARFHPITHAHHCAARRCFVYLAADSIGQRLRRTRSDVDDAGRHRHQTLPGSNGPPHSTPHSPTPAALSLQSLVFVDHDTRSLMLTLPLSVVLFLSPAPLSLSARSDCGCRFRPDA